MGPVDGNESGPGGLEGLWDQMSAPAFDKVMSLLRKAALE